MCRLAIFMHIKKLLFLNILNKRRLTGDKCKCSYFLLNYFTIFISDIGPIDLMSMLTLTWVVLPKEKLFSFYQEFILRQYHLCRKVSPSYHNLLANLQECSLCSEEKLERVLLGLKSILISYYTALCIFVLSKKDRLGSSNWLQHKIEVSGLS